MINFLKVGLMSPRVARGRLVVSLSLFLCLLFLAYCLPSGSSPGSLGFFCLFSFFKFLHFSISFTREICRFICSETLSMETSLYNATIEQQFTIVEYVIYSVDMKSP